MRARLAAVLDTIMHKSPTFQQLSVALTKQYKVSVLAIHSDHVLVGFFWQ